MYINMSTVKKLFIDNTEIIRAYLAGEVVFGQPPAVINKSLRLHYDFSTKTNSDTNRDIIEDLSGNGYHGELQNFAFTDSSGYQGGGLKFDGVDDYVSLESEGLQEYTISITAEIPRHPVIKGLIEGSEDRYIVRRIDILNNINLDFSTNGGSVRHSLDIGTNESIKTNLVFAVNQFTGRVQIYQDGINVADGFVPAQDNPRPFQIIGMGYRFRSAGRYISFFPGSFYSLRQYDKQLTPEEAAELAAEEMRRYGI